MATATPVINQPLEPTVQRRAEGERPATPGTSLPSASAQGRRATDQDREEILQSLYRMRREITQAQRLGKSTRVDEERLADINKYIDHWETVEAPPERAEVFTELAALFPELVSIKAEIERNKRR